MKHRIGAIAAMAAMLGGGYGLDKPQFASPPPRRRPLLKYKHIGEVPKGMRLIVVPFVLEHGDKSFKINTEVLFSTNKGFVKKLRTIEGELDDLRYHYSPQELEDSGLFEVSSLSENLEVDSQQ